MAHQDEGWPLRLQPLNARVGLTMRNQDSYGSVSFNNLLTASPTFATTASSSDLDTESIGSFFNDKSITLGSLIGVSSIIGLTRRSTRGIRTTETLIIGDNKKNPKCKPSWLISLCSKLTTDAVVFSSKHHPPSLAHFLQEERRSVNTQRMNYQIPLHEHGPNDFSPVLPNNISDSSSPFVGGLAAPQSGEFDHPITSKAVLLEEDGNHFEASLLFPCLCGHLIK